MQANSTVLDFMQNKRLNQDSTLIYNAYLGNYQVSENRRLTVSRSLTRLYVYDNQTQILRGLKKLNDSVFSAGNTIIADEIATKYHFSSDYVKIEEGTKPPIRANKKELYTTENIDYLNESGIKLGGTLFSPLKPNGTALVWVHGSGEQDRNGYASIIRLFADILTQQGYTILTYDKQGVGASDGNWKTMGFNALAQDALAGIAYLKKRKDLNLSKIGLAGSSQAGWVIAKAIEQKKKEVDFALLIGAAGSGISVIEQNLYNTRIQMQCSQQFSNRQINNALTQQSLFFDYVLNRRNGEELDKLTALLAKDTLLRNWLFPNSKEVDFTNRNQWYTALELNFDPLSIWRSFDHPTLMLFSEFDDSTPTDTVVGKIKALQNTHIKTVIIPKTQHIGLETNDLCKNDIPTLEKFNPIFFKEIEIWLEQISSH
jgi:hypothetical protein